MIVVLRRQRRCCSELLDLGQISKGRILLDTERWFEEATVFKLGGRHNGGGDDVRCENVRGDNIFIDFQDSFEILA